MFTNLLKNLELLEFLGHEKRPTPTDDGVNGRFQMEAMRCTTFEDATLIHSRKDFPSQIRIQSQVKKIPSKLEVAPHALKMLTG